MPNYNISWFHGLIWFIGFPLLFGFILYLMGKYCACCYKGTNPNITSQSDDQQTNARRNRVLRPTILNGLSTAPIQDQCDQQRGTIMSDMRQLQVNLHPYEVSIVNSVTPSDPPPRLDQEDLPPSYEEAVKIIFSKS